MDCLFCKIISGEIPSEKVYEDEYVYAFNDISQTAPIHVLIVPKKHISTINDIEDQDAELIGRIYLAAKKIAKEKGIDEEGYRVITNCNKMAGQTVFHIHYHLIGGRELGWPAG